MSLNSRPDDYARELQELIDERSQAAHVDSTSPANDSDIINSISSHVPCFALILGINVYKDSHISPLQWAVADAMEMERYLKDTLGVPSSHITILHNERATRAAIINELHRLQVDPRIQPADAILIYYAGHGATAPAPRGWETGGRRIQMLVPYDYDETGSDGPKVYGILDRTIGALLDKVAKVKGDNITVILDCCYSGSGTREPAYPYRSIRGFYTTTEIPEDTDHEIWYLGRGSSTSSGFQATGLTSHVLLAACGAHETAKEEHGRGIFSKALLDVLIAEGANQLTYTELIQRLPSLPQQNPQCEGKNRNRLCFASAIPVRNRTLYKVRQEGRKYIMDAGSAHGVTTGAVFAIYKDPKDFSASAIGQLVALHPGPFSTIMRCPTNQPPIDTGTNKFALRIRAGEEEDLRLHIVADKGLKKIVKCLLNTMDASATDQPRIVLVRRAMAELEVAFKGNEMVFNILDPLVNRHGLEHVPLRVPTTIDSIYSIICAAARYRWHLRRSAYISKLQNKVQVELFRLNSNLEEDDEDFAVSLVPDGPNLISGGVVDLLVDEKEESLYGMRVSNSSRHPLYLELFYFDNSDFSITTLYHPPLSKGTVDPPLPPNQNVCIGYGSEGSPPMTFFLRDGQSAWSSPLHLEDKGVSVQKKFKGL